MGTTRRTKPPAPDTGGEVVNETPVVDTNVGNEPPRRNARGDPWRGEGRDRGNKSDTFPAPDTGNGGASDEGKNDEPDDGSSKYPAEHFFNEQWYSHKRGKLETLLEEDKEYSYAQVERMLSRQ